MLVVLFACSIPHRVIGQLPTGSGHDVDQYGPVLPAIAPLGAGSGMAVDVKGDYAYFIGEGTLSIIDLSDPSKPEILGKLDGLGTTRQIQVREGVAYIVSRSDGMFIVDVSNPRLPALLSRYDSIEFATGLAIGGDVAFLACRLYGVELVDISNPRKPTHISVSRTGVSQSVTYSNGFMYVGVWGEMMVVVVDVRDPWNPVITDKLRLDGYGDGVAVYDGHLYAATGQHSRAKPDDKPGDPGFGAGHGLEIYSLIDPARPRLVSRTKFPKEYHTDSHLWSVRVANDHAFVADNYNGLFVLNVSDPAGPTFVGQHQLPYYEKRKGPHVVTGLAVAKDHILIASGSTEGRVISAHGIATTIDDYEERSLFIGPMPTDRETDGYQAYPMGGQVYSVTVDGDLAYVAAGQGGFHIVSVSPKFERVYVEPTKDRVLDVYARGDYVYVAEGTQGLAIWRKAARGRLALVGRYEVEGEFVRQVVVSESGDLATLIVGAHSIQIVDVQDPGSPVLVFREHGQGILTGDNIIDSLSSNGVAGVFWHKSGHYHKPTDRIRWYDLESLESISLLEETSLGRIKTANGVASMDGLILVVGNGGYRIVDELERGDFRSIPLRKAPGVSLIGKPTVYRDRLYVSHRAGGEIEVLDIQEFDQPKRIKTIITRGNPSRIVPHGNQLLIPGGYEGLLIYDL